MTTIIKNQNDIINNLKSPDTMIRKEAMRQAKSICITQWDPELITTFSDTLDKIRGHKLFPSEVLKTLPPFDVEVPLSEQKAVVKLFNPISGWVWYLSQYNPDEDLAWGLTCGFTRELGYLSLWELKTLTNAWGLPIERDLHWPGENNLQELTEMI